MVRITRSTLLSLLLALALAACGGSDNETPSLTSASVAPESNAPQLTGDTATDGLNWFNFRRQQLGVRAVIRDARADAAAVGHSNYQKANNVITHEQTPGKPGFTGVSTGDRLTAAGYRFTSGYAYGEVISGTSSTSGVNAAEDLIAAVYHRFVIFEPVFRQVGGGAATVSGGLTYFTTNFVTEQLDAGLGAGRVAVYPYSSQLRVPRNFFSDNEAPDPVPGRNEVGYPISVHADITSNITVQRFALRPRGGDSLEVRSLTHASDSETPPSAASIIPLEPLLPATTYDVEFSGIVDGIDVNRAWSFTTQ